MKLPKSDKSDFDVGEGGANGSRECAPDDGFRAG
jgi:hypothetical protein